MKPFRGGVWVRCYGGAIAGAAHVPAEQTKGEAHMKQLGTVEVPQEAFLAVLSTGEG